MTEPGQGLWPLGEDGDGQQRPWDGGGLQLPVAREAAGLLDVAQDLL